MMTVPALPPTIEPTSRPAPPTSIIAVFFELEESNGRTVDGCGILTGATVITFIHERVGSAGGARSMMAGDGTTEDNGAGALSTVVSGRVVLLCAMSGAATKNTAIAVARLRRRDM
jgi:hypothetical protein